MFDQKRYNATDECHDRLLQAATFSEFDGSTVYKTYLHAGLLREWLGDHVLHGQIVFPGAAMLDMALAVCVKGRGSAERQHTSHESVVHLEGFSILHPVVVADSRIAGQSPSSVWCIRESDGSLQWCSDSALGEGGDEGAEEGGREGGRVTHAECAAAWNRPSRLPPWASLEE